MRNLNKNYSFVNGSRTITVTGLTFDIEDIRLIVNETQKYVICSTMQKDLVTSIVGGVITFSNSLPVLATGDKLTIEIDSALPEGIAVLPDYDLYRTKVANGVTLKGIPASASDNADVIRSKILAITGNINVTPYQCYPEEFHDLPTIVASINDIENPYMYAILLSKSVSSIYLAGANKYYLSDGNVVTGSQTAAIGNNTDTSKWTKYVVFASSTPTPSYDFNTATPSLLGQILQVYFYNIYPNGVRFQNQKLGNLLFDSGLKFTKSTFVLNASQFYGSAFNILNFPDFDANATASDRELVLPTSCFQGAAIQTVKFPNGILTLTMNSTFALNTTPLSSIIFPIGIKNISITGSYIFGNTVLSSLIFPSGLDTLTISGQYIFYACTIFSYLYISKPNLSFSGLDTGAFNSATTQAVKIEIEDRWNYSINFSSVSQPNLTASEVETFIIDRLLDLRSTSQENVFIKTTAGALTVWDAVKSDGSALTGHANFKEIFRVGQTVIVNISGTNRSYTIATIPSNNQMTMTSSTNMVAGTYELNHNKIATFGATNLAKLSQAQKDKATLKDWQLA